MSQEPPGGPLHDLIRWGLATAGLFALFGAVFLAPLEAKLEALRLEQDRLEKMGRELEVTAARDDEFRAEDRALQAKLELLDRLLPPQLDADAVITKLRQRGASAEASVVAIRQGVLAERSDHRALPLEIEASGDVAALAELCRRFAGTVPVVSLQRVVIEREDARTCRAQLSLETYAGP
jgi:Tfp pilus assembly protein PilO